MTGDDKGAVGFHERMEAVPSMDFEEAMDMLARVARNMSRPGLSLRKMLRLAEYGQALEIHCNELLTIGDTTPKVMALDGTGRPTGMKDLPVP